MNNRILVLGGGTRAISEAHDGPTHHEQFADDCLVP